MIPERVWTHRDTDVLIMLYAFLHVFQTFNVSPSENKEKEKPSYPNSKVVISVYSWEAGFHPLVSVNAFRFKLVLSWRDEVPPRRAALAFTRPYICLYSLVGE